MIRYKKILLLCMMIFAGFLVRNYILNGCGYLDAGQDLMSNQKISVVLFDFDGTIADSFESSVAVANQLASEYGYQPITEEQKALIKNLPLKDVLLKHFKIKWYQIPGIVMRGKDLMGDKTHADKLNPFDGMHDALTQLTNHNISLGILTSSREERVNHFIDKFKFTCFKTIYADSSLFGKHNCLQRFLDNNGLSAKNVLYVGDEVRDIEAAHTVGMKCIGVTWGYNSEAALVQAKPYTVVKTPAEMADQIIKLVDSSN